MNKFLRVLAITLFFMCLAGCGGHSTVSKSSQGGGIGESCTKSADCLEELLCIKNVCQSNSQIDGDSNDSHFIDGDKADSDQEKLEDQFAGEMSGTCGPDTTKPMAIIDKDGNVIEQGWDFDCDKILDHDCTKYWYDSEGKLTKVVSSGMDYSAMIMHNFYDLLKSNKCWDACEVWLFYPELRTSDNYGDVVKIYGPDDDCDGVGDPRQTPYTDSDSNSDVCVSFVYDGPGRTLSNSGDDLDCNGIPDWRCENMCNYEDKGDYILATCGLDINCKDPANPGNCLKFKFEGLFDLKEVCYRFYDENNLPPPATVKKLDYNGNVIPED